MIQVRWLAVLLLLVAGTWVAAQEANAGTAEFGILRGTVVLDEGQTVPGITVELRIAGQQARLTTGNDGSFRGVVPAGEGVLNAAGCEQRVTVLPGVESTVRVVLRPDKGIVLTISYPDGTPYPGGVSGAFRPEGPHTLANDIALGAGRYWFTDVPADAKQFAVHLLLKGKGTYAMADHFQRWSFTDAQPCRQLRMTLPASAMVVLRVVDAQGRPVANTPIAGVLAYPLHSPFDLWDKETRPRIFFDYDLSVSKLTTDAAGKVVLGELPPRNYALSVTAGKLSGGTVRLEVQPGQPEAQLTYTVLQLDRQVTHTAYDKEKQPVPNAEMFASYCWGGKLVVRRAQADRTGRVSWTEMPPVDAIVWGNGVPAGVLPGDVRLLTSPLASPVAGPEKRLKFQHWVSGTAPTRYANGMICGDTVRSIRGEWKPQRGISGLSAGGAWDIACGTSFDMHFAEGADVPHLRYLRGVYLPPMDDDLQALDLPLEAIPFTTLDSVTIDGAVLTADRKPAAGVTGLEIVPAGDNILAGFVPGRDFDWLVTVTLGSNGQFTASLPPTGAYLARLSLQGKPAPVEVPFTCTPENSATPISLILP